MICRSVAAAILVTTLAAGLALAATVRIPTLHRHEVEIVRFIDADTVVVRPLTTITIRLSNADAWESKRVRRTDSGPISDEEIAKGLKAKAAVIKLTAGKRICIETTDSTDSFGRELGTVHVFNGPNKAVTDIGEWLKANGHTRTDK